MPSVNEELRNTVELMRSIDLLTKKLTKERLKVDAMKRELIKAEGILTSPNPSYGNVFLHVHNALSYEDRIEQTGKL